MPRRITGYKRLEMLSRKKPYTTTEPIRMKALALQVGESFIVYDQVESIHGRPAYGKKPFPAPERLQAALTYIHWRTGKSFRRRRLDKGVYKIWRVK